MKNNDDDQRAEARPPRRISDLRLPAESGHILGSMDGGGDQSGNSAGASSSSPPETAARISLSGKRQRKRSEVIAHELSQYIVDSGLAPGTMLPREKEMLEQLGVGRTTLREALRILEIRGLLTIRSGPGGGPVVRTPQPSDLTEALTLILQFQRATMLEILDARIWLEPIAARMATPQITHSEIDGMRRANQEMKESDPSSITTSEANHRFHTIIASATGNLPVQVFADTLQTVAEAGGGDLRHSEALRALSTDGHDEIIAAFEARDPDRVEEAMREHIRAGKELRHKENPELMSRPLRWLE
jgi:DNA-binding FadR family transcriptional regulator